MPPRRPGGSTIPAARSSLALEEASFAGQPVGGALKATLAPSIELSGALDLEAASLPFLVSLAAGTEPDVGDAAGATRLSPPPCRPAPRSISRSTPRRSTSARRMPATDAKLDFSLSGGVLSSTLTKPAFAGGTLKGALRATLHEGEADMSLRGGLTGGDLQALTWEQAGLPAASGKLDCLLRRDRARPQHGRHRRDAWRQRLVLRSTKAGSMR